MWTQDATSKTCQEQCMIGKDGEIEPEDFVLPTRFNDDDDLVQKWFFCDPIKKRMFEHLATVLSTGSGETKSVNNSLYCFTYNTYLLHSRVGWNIINESCFMVLYSHEAFPSHLKELIAWCLRCTKTGMMMELSFFGYHSKSLHLKLDFVFHPTFCVGVI